MQRVSDEKVATVASRQYTGHVGWLMRDLARDLQDVKKEREDILMEVRNIAMCWVDTSHPGVKGREMIQRIESLLKHYPREIPPDAAIVEIT